jgi:ribosomal protein S12 methylthiotransferase accessory factor YcaO
MLSFAPIFYRDVFEDRGGPIASVHLSQLPIFGQNQCQANAFLSPGLITGKPHQMVFGNADGTGSSTDPAVAKHIAISEALERWAFFETQRESETKFGFDHDRSSNGMAAYPGFSRQAKRRARFEALERFALVGWWDRRFRATVMKAPYPDVGLVRIHHGVEFGEVVVLYHRSLSGSVAYGHAAGRNLATATSRAAIELVRAEYVIARHRARGGLAEVTDPFERRWLYYTGPEGYAEFLEHAYASPEKSAPKWKTIFDGPIPGPWSKWAVVWRHCVEMPTYAFLDSRANFFG